MAFRRSMLPSSILKNGTLTNLEYAELSLLNEVHVLYMYVLLSMLEYSLGFFDPLCGDQRR